MKTTTTRSLTSKLFILVIVIALCGAAIFVVTKHNSNDAPTKLSNSVNKDGVTAKFPYKANFHQVKISGATTKVYAADNGKYAYVAGKIDVGYPVPNSYLLDPVTQETLVKYLTEIINKSYAKKNITATNVHFVGTPNMEAVGGVKGGFTAKFAFTAGDVDHTGKIGLASNGTQIVFAGIMAEGNQLPLDTEFSNSLSFTK